MVSLRAHHSPLTGAFVQDYEPVRVFFYDQERYSPAFLNPLAKALLTQDPRLREGRWLFELTADPDAADIITPPYDLSVFEDRIEDLRPKLPHYPGAERRHVFFDFRDDPTVPDFLAESIFFKASLYAGDAGPRRICLPYTERIDDFFPRFAEPPEPRYDISFVGETSPRREPVIAAVQATGLRTRIICRRENYYGPAELRGVERLSTAATSRRTGWRREFLDVTSQSRFVLAVAGYGLNSFRFYEALSLGVPPILVAEDIALPFPHHVDYDEFCLRLRLDDEDLTRSIRMAVASVDDALWLRMRRLARLSFDTYLSTRNLLSLLYQAIRETTAVEPQGRLAPAGPSRR